MGRRREEKGGREGGEGAVKGKPADPFRKIKALKWAAVRTG